MKKGDYLPAILRAKQSVFSSKELMLLWGDVNTNAAKVRINYYVAHNKLYRIRRGFYAKSKQYDKFELATKIYTPSYVSFETVLAREGVIFQYYEQIFIASYLAREIMVDQQLYAYKAVKNSILINHIGLKVEDCYSIATLERAFLDTLYLHTDYHFDNLSQLNWKKVFEILPLYGGNKRMHMKVKQHYEKYRE